ncbi:hypothetical protein [Treponema sp. R80B11-R83G3]
MENTPLTLLNLCTSLPYIKSECQDPSLLKYEKLENEEILLCYEVNPVQGCSIEPERDYLLDKLLFIGQKLPERENEDTDEKERNNLVSLPQGNYLFTQCRSDAVLNSDEWLDLAIEQQKDGLWERNKPGNLLYVRFLFEDGSFVTQVFRAV